MNTTENRERSFHEVAREYASHKNPEWLALSPRSREIYVTGLKSLDRFDNLNIRSITRSAIISLKDDLYHSRGRCRLALAVLNNVLRYAYDRGYVEYNHAAGIRGLPKQVGISRWTKEEVDTFLDMAPERLRLAVALALYTGQRRSDLVRMLWADYNGTSIRVKQQKTGTPLVIPVHPYLKRLLDRTVHDGPFILTNAYGQPFVADTMQRSIRRECKRLGIDKTIHGLRKSAAAALAEAGCTVHQIRAITGHKSLKQIENYTAEAEQEKMAKEAMDLWK